MYSSATRVALVTRVGLVTRYSYSSGVGSQHSYSYSYSAKSRGQHSYSRPAKIFYSSTTRVTSRIRVEILSPQICLCFKKNVVLTMKERRFMLS